MHLQRHRPLPHTLSEDARPLLSYLPQPCRLQYVHLTVPVIATSWSPTFLHDSSISREFILFTSFCFSCDSVIEVASGEYGDMNPVLFEAVQGGMCAVEEKNQSVCATICPVVSNRCYSTRGRVCCRDVTVTAASSKDETCLDILPCQDDRYRVSVRSSCQSFCFVDLFYYSQYYQ